MLYVGQPHTALADAARQLRPQRQEEAPGATCPEDCQGKDSPLFPASSPPRLTPKYPSSCSSPAAPLFIRSGRSRRWRFRVVWVGTMEQLSPSLLNSRFFSPNARGDFTRDEIRAQHLQMVSFLWLWSLQRPLNWNKNTNVIPRGGRACHPSESWADLEFSALLLGAKLHFFHLP